MKLTRKIIAFLLIVAPILNSCIGDGMTDFQREYFKKKKVGLSENELRLISELQDSGYYDVRIKAPDYIVESLNSFNYVLSMSVSTEPNTNFSNYQKNVLDSLVDHLYTVVMSDGEIVCCNKISIQLKLIDSKKSDKIIKRSILKSDLEKKHNYQVVQLDENTFERIKLK